MGAWLNELDVQVLRGLPRLGGLGKLDLLLDDLLLLFLEFVNEVRGHF